MPRRNRRKMKDVHFYFSAHAEDNPFIPPVPGKRLIGKSKTILVERPVHVNMFGGNQTGELHDYFQMYPGSKLERTGGEFISAAQRKKIKVGVGEHFLSERAREKFEKLKIDAEKKELTVSIFPDLEKIKAYFDARAAHERYRHQLIVNAIRKTEKPVGLRYGSLHSVVLADLRKKRIHASREIPRGVFSWAGRLDRKLVLGKKAADVEYKRGYVSRWFENHFRQQYGLELRTNQDIEMYNLFDAIAIGKLSESRLNAIIDGPGKNLEKVFEWSGLPKYPKKEDIIVFVKKNSPYWKRVEEYRRRRRAARNKSP